jgi:hypothetical protein
MPFDSGVALFFMVHARPVFDTLIERNGVHQTAGKAGMTKEMQRVREILEDIAKASRTPANEVNLVPEMTLEFISSQARMALAIFGASAGKD